MSMYYTIDFMTKGLSLTELIRKYHDKNKTHDLYVKKIAIHYDDEKYNSSYEIIDQFYLFEREYDMEEYLELAMYMKNNFNFNITNLKKDLINIDTCVVSLAINPTNIHYIPDELKTLELYEKYINEFSYLSNLETSFDICFNSIPNNNIKHIYNESKKFYFTMIPKKYRNDLEYELINVFPNYITFIDQEHINTSHIEYLLNRTKFGKEFERILTKYSEYVTKELLIKYYNNYEINIDNKNGSIYPLKYILLKLSNNDQINVLENVMNNGKRKISMRHLSNSFEPVVIAHLVNKNFYTFCEYYEKKYRKRFDRSYPRISVDELDLFELKQLDLVMLSKDIYHGYDIDDYIYKKYGYVNSKRILRKKYINCDIKDIGKIPDELKTYNFMKEYVENLDKKLNILVNK